MIYNAPYGTEVNFHMNQTVGSFSIAQPYRNLVGVPCVTKNEFIIRMRDFICSRSSNLCDYTSVGLGWELIDTHYSADENDVFVGDWYVIKSSVPNSIDMFFKISYEDSGYIQIKGYQYWNSDSHIGTHEFYNNAAHIALDQDMILWIYGDLSGVSIISKISAYAVFMFGRTSESIYDQNSIYSSDVINAGSDQWINFDNNINSFTDDNIYVYDENNIEIVTIKAIDTAAKKLKVSLTHNFPNGLHAVPEHGIFIQATNDLTTVDNFRALITDNGALNSSGNWDIASDLLDEHNPEELNQDHISTKISISGSGFWGYIRNVQIIGFMASIEDEELLNDRTHNWKLFNVNGFNLLFKEV